MSKRNKNVNNVIIVNNKQPSSFMIPSTFSYVSALLYYQHSLTIIWSSTVAILHNGFIQAIPEIYIKFIFNQPKNCL